MESWLSVAGLGGTGILAATCAYKFLRPRFPVRVNCWFCNTDTIVPYGNQNCWDCPKCEQYNGFDKTGGYNKEIPAQYLEDLNHGISCSPDEYLGGHSRLCEACEQNQLLKVKQLASFVPMIEDNYDAEVDAYKDHLEQIYELCDGCRSLLDQELAKQNDALRVRLEANNFNSSAVSVQQQSSMTSMQVEPSSCRHTAGYVLGLLSLLCACFILAYRFPQSSSSVVYTFLLSEFVQIVQPCTQILHYIGLILCLGSKLLIGKDRLRVVDVAMCFTWLLGAATETREITHMLPRIAAEDKVLLALFSLNFVMTLACCVLRRERNTNTNLTFKRLSLDKSTGSMASETDTVAISSVSTSRRTQPDPEPVAGETDQPLDDLDLDLDAFSLGPKTNGLKRSDSGMFSMTGSQTSFAPASAVPRPLIGQPRPLISPARLKVRPSSSTPTNFFNPTTTSQRTIVQNPAFDLKSRQSLQFSTLQKPAQDNNLFLQQGLTTEKLSLFNTQQNNADPPTSQSANIGNNLGQSSPLRSNLWQHANFAKTHLSPDKLSQCQFSSHTSQTSLVSQTLQADSFRSTSRPNTPIRKSLWQQQVVEEMRNTPLVENNVFMMKESSKTNPLVSDSDTGLLNKDSTAFMTSLEDCGLRQRTVQKQESDLTKDNSSRSSECPVDSTTVISSSKYTNLRKFGIGAILVASVFGNAVLGIYLYSKP